MLSDLAIRSGYRTEEDNLVLDFYIPCLENARHYDRSVGYFRSSIFKIIGRHTISFSKNGGKIRLICSPDLDKEDIDSIESGLESRKQKALESVRKDIDQLFTSSENRDHVKLLSTLIALDVLDIRIAFRCEGNGIYHEKIGIFTDKTENKISFIGSVNETISGWSNFGNYESIESFANWHSDSEESRVNRHVKYFETLWNGKCKGVHTLEFDSETRSKISQFAEPSLDDVESKWGKHLSQNISTKPPMPHQSQAIENWKLANCKGVLEHATGSGKTITAIIAIREHVSNGLPALVLVPSDLLLGQWEKELLSEIPGVTLLTCGSGNISWKRPRRLATMSSGHLEGECRVILSTMQTAASSEFRAAIEGSQDLLMVADEVHQIGSAHLSNCLQIDSGKRLGLSATPARFGDFEGTQRILKYFGEIIDPKFSLQDAINSGRLVQYEYFPVAVSLSSAETASWNKYSERIRLEYFNSKKAKSNSSGSAEKHKTLLIQRSRIAKKAENKIHKTSEILQTHFEEGDSWLIYCEDYEQLSEIGLSLKSTNISYVEYHSGLDESRKFAVLEYFKTFGGILLSIRCLDEGIDIPQINKALIIASSQNPRQFIQRRGRVLRNYKGKGFAKIFDIIVTPGKTDTATQNFSLLKAEMKRAIEFSNSAINKYGSIELRDIAERFGLNSDELIDDQETEET